MRLSFELLLTKKAKLSDGPLWNTCPSGTRWTFRIPRQSTVTRTLGSESEDDDRSGCLPRSHCRILVNGRFKGRWSLSIDKSPAVSRTLANLQTSDASERSLIMRTSSIGSFRSSGIPSLSSAAAMEALLGRSGLRPIAGAFLHGLFQETVLQSRFRIFG